MPTLLTGALIVPLGLSIVLVAVNLALAVGVFGASIAWSGLLIALPAVVLTVVTFCAFGIFSASFIVLTKRGDPFTFFAAQATTLLAGTLFPTTLLPGPVQALVRAVPAFYGLRALRNAMLSHVGVAGVAGDTLVLAAFAVVLLPISLWAFSHALAAARVTGTLGTY